MDGSQEVAGRFVVTGGQCTELLPLTEEIFNQVACFVQFTVVRGFDRLAVRVQTVIGQSPLSGHLFVLRSRCNTRLKLLAWDHDGYALWYKRLEAGVFKLPKLTPGTRSVELKASELAMLLEGIDLSKLKRTPRYQHPSAAAARSEKTNDESVTPLHQKHPH